MTLWLLLVAIDAHVYWLIIVIINRVWPWIRFLLLGWNQSFVWCKLSVLTHSTSSHLLYFSSYQFCDKSTVLFLFLSSFNVWVATRMITWKLDAVLNHCWILIGCNCFRCSVIVHRLLTKSRTVSTDFCCVGIFVTNMVLLHSLSPRLSYIV